MEPITVEELLNEYIKMFDESKYKNQDHQKSIKSFSERIYRTKH